LASAISAANQAYLDGQAALAKGDFSAYGKAQAALADALKRITDAGAAVTQ
jgi:hypothetical protein